MANKYVNPAKKAKRYCNELHVGANTYTGEVLSKRQKAYRAGYTAARSDNAKVYNWRKAHTKKTKVKKSKVAD